VLRQLKELEMHDSVDYYNIAIVHLGLGEKDQAFKALERAYEQRSGSMAFLKCAPFWTDVLSDVRYRELLLRIGKGFSISWDRPIPLQANGYLVWS